MLFVDPDMVVKLINTRNELVGRGPVAGEGATRNHYAKKIIVRYFI